MSENNKVEVSVNVESIYENDCFNEFEVKEFIKEEVKKEVVDKERILEEIYEKGYDFNSESNDIIKAIIIAELSNGFTKENIEKLLKDLRNNNFADDLSTLEEVLSKYNLIDCYKEELSNYYNEGKEPIINEEIANELTLKIDREFTSFNDTYNKRLEELKNILNEEELKLFEFKRSYIYKKIVFLIPFMEYINENSINKEFPYVNIATKDLSNYFNNIIIDFLDYEKSYIKDSFNHPNFHIIEHIVKEFNERYSGYPEEKVLDQLFIAFMNDETMSNYFFSIFDSLSIKEDDKYFQAIIIGTSYSSESPFVFTIQPISYNKENMTCKWNFTFSKKIEVEGNKNTNKVIHSMVYDKFSDALKAFFGTMSIIDCIISEYYTIHELNDIKDSFVALGETDDDKEKFFIKLGMFLASCIK